MNKNQNPTTLKVRKALVPNHNETALKVQMDWPLSTNHNETALKIHKALTSNHNETALRLK